MTAVDNYLKSPEALADLKRLNARFIHNFVTNDVASHDALLHPDFTVIQRSAAHVGRAAYLANSTFIASTSLASQTLSVFRIDGAKLNTDVKLIRTQSGVKNSVRFQYDFFSVVDHKERPVKLFYYDESKKSFRFPIVIQDKKTPQGRVTNRFITYRFYGKYFERVK